MLTYLKLIDTHGKAFRGRAGMRLQVVCAAGRGVAKGSMERHSDEGSWPGGGSRRRRMVPGLAPALCAGAGAILEDGAKRRVMH
ncbi:MAG: hypothetical protein R3D67_01115 [Hyphomicrobiaceae bacterium]